MLKQLAADYPHDSSLQEQYVHALAEAGDYPAAYAWLERVLARNPAGCLTRKIPSAERMPGSSKPRAAMPTWWTTWPPGREESRKCLPYSRYLSALVYADRLDKANALVAQWLREGQAAMLTAAAAARLQAAVFLSLGQGHNINTNRIDERWRKPLAEAALLFAFQDRPPPPPPGFCPPGSSADR